MLIWVVSLLIINFLIYNLTAKSSKILSSKKLNKIKNNFFKVSICFTFFSLISALLTQLS